MIKIEQIDIKNKSFGEILEMLRDDQYFRNHRIIYKETSGKWSSVLLELKRLEDLKDREFAIIKFSEEKDLRDIPVEDIAKELPELIDEIPVEEKSDSTKMAKLRAKYDISKEPKVTNKACYAVLASNSTGSLTIIPKSNGAIRVNCDSKNQADAVLRAFKRKITYTTNSVDYFKVSDFYEYFGIVVSDEVMAKAKEYGWATVTNIHDTSNWLSPQVTKCADDTGWYGFTISKRATHINKSTKIA